MILRGPRLALIDLNATAAAQVAGYLAGVFDQWHTPVRIIMAPGQHPPPTTRYGSTEAVSPLGRVAWAEAGDPARHANGGDVSLLVGTAGESADGCQHLTGETFALAVATRTPVVLVLTVGAQDPGIATRIAARLATHTDCCATLVAGVIRVADGPGASTDADAEALAGWADFGLLTIPADPPADVAGSGLDIRSLISTGSRAPVMIDADEARQRPPRRAPPAPRPRNGCRALMVQGTHSSAGKSFLVTGLARLLSDSGLRVAPFKGQNMSNNARVVDGGEIGVAQYLQALAARCTPDVRMNPVLLKPRLGGTDVIVRGVPDPDVARLAWRLRKPLLWPAVRTALAELRSEFDVLLIEGAGSPAELHLYHNDIVNMRVANESGARVILAADASRGGAIAQCYGTWKLLPPADRQRLGAFVFNRFFREGNPALFTPGSLELTNLTGVPSLGIVPEMINSLPEEDLYGAARGETGSGRMVAIIRYPQISNFDEFAVLRNAPGVRLVWAEHPAAIDGADLLILPGSKHVAADLAWMRERGIDRAVRVHAANGGRLLGVCGGLQMLGEAIDDPDGVEGASTGLGLLPLRTTFRREKVQVRRSTTLAGLDGPWSSLDGVRLEGYEIRHGVTEATAPGVGRGDPPGLAFGRHNVLGLYLHGLFENAEALHRVLDVEIDAWRALDGLFDEVSAHLREHLDPDLLERLVGA